MATKYATEADEIVRALDIPWFSPLMECLLELAELGQPEAIEKVEMLRRAPQVALDLEFWRVVIHNFAVDEKEN